MNNTLEMSFKNSVSYDQKCEIDIRLQRAMTSEDYKTVTEAAETMLKTIGKYITKPEPKADTKEKE